MISSRLIIINVLCVICLYASDACAQTANGKLNALYQDSSRPVKERVEDLLSRMTLREKVGQLLCLPGWEMYDLDKAKNPTLSPLFVNSQDSLCVGAYWAVMRACPWTGRNLLSGLTPQTAAKQVNEMQHYAVEKTRLGIPLLLCEETPHGHMAIGTTVFPTGLGLAATFSETLVKQVGKTIARELTGQGGNVAFGPVLDLARDPRWSRTEETLGEDPTLAARLGAAFVSGLHSNGYRGVAPVLKHFAAYSVGTGGQNGASVSLGEREMRQIHLPPFQNAISASADGIMTAYNAIDGIPSSGNSHLLRDILREEWRFRGTVFSDLYSIDVMYNTLGVASSLEDAARIALNAGVDIDLGGNAYRTLSDWIKEGSTEECLLNEAVRRVLTLKFELGLFEHPFVDEKAVSELVHTTSNVRLARDLARASVTLLKNTNGLLPLGKNCRVAVVGANSDDIYAQLGDYTAPQPDDKVVTVADGVRAITGHIYPPGEADVIVAVVGGSSSRYTGANYEITGALRAEGRILGLNSNIPDSGEGLDRQTLDLPAEQIRQLEELTAYGKPLVVLYIEGRPLNKNWAAEHADALLTAYYPGEQGGAAIADVLFGDYNPAGRLPISVPRSIGQLPVCYDRLRPLPHAYTDGSATPLYPFGYGLSYTQFSYSDLTLSDTLVTCRVTNSGLMDGEEVVQLYLRDEAASVVLPERSLRSFQRVFIRKGESATVRFRLRREDFSVLDSRLQKSVEPGTFTVMIGSSSQDIRLKGEININRNDERN